MLLRTIASYKKTFLIFILPAVKYHIDEKQVMARSNDNYNPAEKNYLIWFFISMAIVVMLNFFLPFPVSFIISLIVIFCVSIYRDDMALRKAGMGGIKGWYKSMFSSGFGRRRGTGIKGSAYQSLRFSCMNCGNEHNKIACPKCGSKAVRAV
jgi:hypothetical protein